MSRELLLEIGTEDLPARFVLPLAEALRRGVSQGLQKRGVDAGTATLFATPRRIAVRVTAVVERQPDQTVERHGPALAAAIKDGQPTPAGLGFAKSCGVAFDELGQQDGKLYHRRQMPGRPTAELLPEIFEDTLKEMDTLVPKRMRWGSGDETFVRPVLWLACLFGDETVPLQRFGLTAGNLSYGHRFHAPAAVALESPEAYESRLKDAWVWVDVDSRKAEIRRQIEAEAARAGGHVRITEDLLDEVTALVEWPVAITGHFEARFLELPPEVIVATVETNQRYFTVFEDAAQTRLTSAFITVSNIESKDVAQVIAGNERVVRPRLADALFFWQQDRAQPLSASVTALANLTFQQKLGSVADKQARIVALTERVAGLLGLEASEAAAAREAAGLCKCDLVTKMVFEFPELQGLMGGYYAAAGGASDAVARAIREHYLPAQQGTPIPGTRAGQLVALADKLDSLAGIFAIGQKPSASKDPFALRRAALGVLRLLVEGGLPLDLRELLRLAVSVQPVTVPVEPLVEELLGFVLDRLRALRVGSELDGRPLAAETYESVAVLGLSAPLDIDQRLQAMHRFAVHPAAPNLAAANKRIRNLLRQAGGEVDTTVRRESLEHTAEHALWTTVTALEGRLQGQQDYEQRLQDLASLRDPVDAFFEAVMVNAEQAELRRNRLALLARVDALCRSVADLSQLPG